MGAWIWWLNNEIRQNPFGCVFRFEVSQLRWQNSEKDLSIPLFTQSGEWLCIRLVQQLAVENLTLALILYVAF